MADLRRKGAPTPAQPWRPLCISRYYIFVYFFPASCVQTVLRLSGSPLPHDPRRGGQDAGHSLQLQERRATSTLQPLFTRPIRANFTEIVISANHGRH